MKKILFITFLFVLSLQQFCSAAEAGNNLYLKNGELWLANAKQESFQLSQTDKKVDGFSVSPSGLYVAAHKIIGETIDPDATLPEDQQPKTPIFSVLIFSVSNHSLIRELIAQEDFLHIGEWNEKNTYKYSTGSMLDVSASYEFDPSLNRLWEMKYDENTSDFVRDRILE